MKNKMVKYGFLTLLLIATQCLADPYVIGADDNPDPNFVVAKLMPRLDGQIPRLETIRNPVYGTGVIAASIDNGILKVYRISNRLIAPIGSISGYPNKANTNVLLVRFDWTGQYGKDLFLTVGYDSGGIPSTDSTDLIRISQTGQFIIEAFAGPTPETPNDQLGFIFEFALDEYSQASIYFVDSDYGGGTSFYMADREFNLSKIYQNFLPSNRSDLDISGIKYDSTGRYSNRLTMVDWDPEQDEKCVIYQIYRNGSQWTWSELNTPVHSNSRYYRDLAFSSGGSFCQQLYVTERYSNAVQAIEPDGSDREYAKGFNNIESITISDNGEHMYVSDSDGIWHIYNKISVTIGPEYVMRDPRADIDGVHTDTNGINSVRLLFNEPIQFTDEDVEITNEPNQTVPLSVTGSGSQFMIISFGQTLLNDKYTITVKDSVVSVLTGASIDGDHDGQAGGDYVFTMEHRERHDSDNDNDIDLYDLAELAEKWLWSI